jgi:hypothetical protein
MALFCDKKSWVDANESMSKHTYYVTEGIGMPKRAKGLPTQTVIEIDPRKIKELRRLLKVKTEEEAVRIAIEEALQNHRTVRSLNRFLDTLAQEQTSVQS